MLRILKRSFFWLFFIEYIFYPFYHFVWSYIINFNGKVLYFLWMFKKKDFFSLGKNDKLIIEPTNESKAIANKILEESKSFIGNSKKTILSKEYSERISKHNLSTGQIPYTISIYENLSDNLKKEIVQFASSDKLVTTALSYMKVFPILTRVQVYYNIPRENSKLRGAMFWHKDGFGFKNLDFFMCVTDLNESNGPFYCLKKKINAGIFKSFDYLFKDKGERNKVSLENFSKHFKDEEVLTFTGPSGKAILLDSFSTFHRGGFCERNDRIMLRFCYQTHDTLCEELEHKNDYFLFDHSIKKKISKISTRNIYFLKNHL